MGDGIASWIDDIKELYPGIFVHSVQIPEGGSPDEERRAGFVRQLPASHLACTPRSPVVMARWGHS
jgi:hypothetical protein